MNIQQLKGFLAVARYGCLSLAAKKTYRAQPAVSLQIKALEAELGTRLFDRAGGRKAKLTAEGKALLELAEPILNSIQTLPARFNEARGALQKGYLRCVTHSSVIARLLPPVIKAFKKRFPDCDLSFFTRSREGILKMLDDGEADFGIGSLTTVPQRFDYRVFAKFSRMLIAESAHPLAKGRSIALANIAAFPLVLPPHGSNTRSVVDQAFRAKEMPYNISMEASGRDSIKTYVAMGLGVSIVNSYYLDANDRKDLFVRDVSAHFGEAERGIITRKNHFLSYHTKEFIQMLTSHYHK